MIWVSFGRLQSKKYKYYGKKLNKRLIDIFFSVLIDRLLRLAVRFWINQSFNQSVVLDYGFKSCKSILKHKRLIKRLNEYKSFHRYPVEKLCHFEGRVCRYRIPIVLHVHIEFQSIEIILSEHGISEHLFLKSENECFQPFLQLNKRRRSMKKSSFRNEEKKRYILPLLSVFLAFVQFFRKFLHIE